MLKKAVKVVGACLAIVFVFTASVNYFAPLFHKKVSEETESNMSSAEFEDGKKNPERVLCIDSNEDALLWRLRIIAGAKERIILSTFNMCDDESGTDVMSALSDAAERGVKVQLLIDGFYRLPCLEYSDAFNALISQKNVEARFYNCVNAENALKVNYRMHDKYIITDDKMYLLGGRNTNDSFLGSYEDDANVDREILVYETGAGEGESLRQLYEYFEKVWNEPCCEAAKSRFNAEKNTETLIELRRRYGELNEKYETFSKYDGWTQASYDADSITLLSNGTDNANKEPRLLHKIEKICEGAHEVTIQTPYLICNDYMYSVIESIALTAETQIITNAPESGANPFGCCDYLNNKKKLLETGAYICELTGDSVHTKTILVDDNISIVGSYNFDMRSTYLDTELMLVIDSVQLNSHIRALADDYTERGRTVSPDGTHSDGALYEESDMPVIKKIAYTVFRVLILPIRHLL